MSDKQQTPSTSTVRRSLILIIVAIVVGTAWFVWQSKDETDKTLNNAKQATEDANKSDDNADQYKGWKTFSWTSQGVSFKHPGDWTTSETASMGRLYVKNSTVDLLKEETPADFQQVWLSVDTDETATARETAIKAGTSDFRVVNGAVKASTVKAGSLTINVYEYETIGGLTLEAYFTNKAGTRVFATTSTEVGEQNQKDMVANLKKLLASVTLQ